MGHFEGGIVKEREVSAEMIAEIRRFQRERNAVILAHNYQRPEIQELADYTGDSLELSIKAAKTDADMIVFAGGTAEFVVDFPGVVFKTYSLTYTVSGGELLVQQTCPNQTESSPAFEATETTFKWLNGKELTYFKKI